MCSRTSSAIGTVCRYRDRGFRKDEGSALGAGSSAIDIGDAGAVWKEEEEKVDEAEEEDLDLESTYAFAFAFEFGASCAVEWNMALALAWVLASGRRLKSRCERRDLTGKGGMVKGGGWGRVGRGATRELMCLGR